MDEDKDFVVVTVSGDDRPGILAAPTKIPVEGHVVKEVSRITEKTLRGEIDFEDALRQPVALLKGCPLHSLRRSAETLDFPRG